MTTDSSTAGAPRTQTHKLTAWRPMGPKEFWGRIARNSSVSVAHRLGFIDVFDRDGQHVARWLRYPKKLWYLPAGETPERTLDDQNKRRRCRMMEERETAVMLECSYWVQGPGLCGWRGPSTEAGWCDYFEEWVCPRCGASEGLRTVEGEEG